MPPNTASKVRSIMEPTKHKILKNGREKWELYYGRDELGHRKRTTHDTEAEADAIIDKYRKTVSKSGEWWARLPEKERLQIQATCVDIKSAALTLPQVWEDHKRWRTENAQTCITSMPYEDAVMKWGERKLEAGKSEEYIREAKKLLMRFGQGRERIPIHTVTVHDLGTWRTSQKTWGLSSKKTNTSLFSSLWETAVAMGWCSINIVDRLEPIQRPGQVIKIYPNETILNLMAAAMVFAPAAIAPLSLGAFGCMRPEEVSEPPEDPQATPFSWDDIDLKHGQITVRPEVAKTGDQRTIRLHKTALSWLKLAKELKNPLPPVNERRLVDLCCEMIGLDEWIRDGLRKNCATHLRWYYKKDHDVINDMGNSVRILLKHYAKLHTPDAVSEEYYTIDPDRVQAYIKTPAWKAVLDAASQQALSASGISTP